MQGGEDYTVRQGDTLVSIAHARGYRSWETIWLHERNASLREQREPQVLEPGDALFIPPKTPKEHVLETGKQYSFVVKTLKAAFRIRLTDEAGRPLPRKKFSLELADRTLDGVTDADAVVELGIPPDATEGRLTVWCDDPDGEDYKLTWNLKLGHLDPIDASAGLRARLTNLGFLCGDIDGQDEDALADALSRFQLSTGLEVTGEADEATRKKLLAAHDNR